MFCEQLTLPLPPGPRAGWNANDPECPDEWVIANDLQNTQLTPWWVSLIDNMTVISFVSVMDRRLLLSFIVECDNENKKRFKTIQITIDLNKNIKYLHFKINIYIYTLFKSVTDKKHSRTDNPLLLRGRLNVIIFFLLFIPNQYYVINSTKIELLKLSYISFMYRKYNFSLFLTLHWSSFVCYTKSTINYYHNWVLFTNTPCLRRENKANSFRKHSKKACNKQRLKTKHGRTK